MLTALDLFCCGGGSTTGLQRAGFRVVGVDHKRQKEYCGDDFPEADLSTISGILRVLNFVGPDFVSASPPCQRNSVATGTHARERHADLIPVTRAALTEYGCPAWIENVPPIPSAKWPSIVRPDVLLCGSMFPETRQLRRHRHFELIEWFTLGPPHDHCTYEAVSVAGHGPPDAKQSARYRRRRLVESIHNGSECTNSRKMRARRRLISVVGDSSTGNREPRDEPCTSDAGQNRPGPECIRWREAMGWIDGPRSRYCLAQAVPPAYAEWLGRAFIAKAGA